MPDLIKQEIKIDSTKYWKQAVCAAILFIQGLLGTALLAHPAEARNAEAESEVTRSDQSDLRNPIERLADVDWAEWENIEALLNNVREATAIPTIAAAVVVDGKIVDYATVGVRKFGTQDRVTPGDQLHLGSITKSMTATVIGKLVEQGQLSWSTTIAGTLSNIPMRKEYEGVTMEQLLHHRGGLHAYTNANAEQRARIREYSGTPTEVRAKFAADLLQERPLVAPGTAMEYSNAGYALAGHMAERITGTSWEDLIRQHIFAPLGMHSGGFGFPGTSAAPEQPCGHDGSGPVFVPLAEHHHPPMDFIAPAGDVHCSVADLARYARFHLQGLNGKDGHLRSETIKRLHALPSVSVDPRYACGWLVRTERSGEKVHYHNGSTGAFYAELSLYPERRAAVAVMTNVGTWLGEPVAGKVGRSLVARFTTTPRSADAKSTHRMQGFQFKTNDAKGSDGAWHSSDEKPDITFGEKSSAAIEAGIWTVIEELAETINNEERKAFKRLFHEHDEAQDQVFTFMARQVLPTRGGIRSFHELSVPITSRDSKTPIYAATFHLENGYPGYIGVSLTKDGKIDHFSLFVKSDLCPSGADTHCKKIVRKIGKDLNP